MFGIVVNIPVIPALLTLPHMPIQSIKTQFLQGVVMLQVITKGLKGWEPTIFSFGLIFFAFLAGLFLYGIIFHFLDRASRRIDWFDHRMVDRWATPARVLVPLILIVAISPFLSFAPEISAVVRHFFILCLIANCAWLFIATVLGLRDVILARYDLTVKDNLKARTVHTQVNILVKISVVMLVIVALALALMTFDRIRQVGISILASAGIIGIIVGVAAQKPIAHFLAGIQIALSQPIRIDDVVIIEGEWGVVESITLTYVEVRVWDRRRLVVPIIYFLEKPFQNWTRASAHLIGTVMFHTDYTIPVEKVRSELGRILADAPFWNGETWALQVTDAKEHTLELRALVSADNAGDLWELRCYVREKLVEFIRSNYPECPPRFRADMG